jgi:tetratricopeptide (TPR) repeat protein
MRIGFLAITFLAVAGVALAQQEQQDVHITPRVPEKIPQRSNKQVAAPSTSEEKQQQDEIAGPLTPNESSSRSTKIDLSPPKDERSKYPDSDVGNDVQEVRPWDPHKAQKDVEVGDFYFKRENYRGAIARYESALHWQDNNAEAMWKAALTSEKLGNKDVAAKYYAAYIKTLPRGEHAEDANKAIARLAH